METQHYLVNDKVTTEIKGVETCDLIELAHLDSDELEDDFDKHLDEANAKILILHQEYTYSEIAKDINYSSYKRAKAHFVETEVMLGNYFSYDDEIFCKA
jgi:hypothetical protein